MPSEGVELSPDGNLLTNEEVIRLATLFVQSGVTKIRLTGGEPTVRKGIMDLMGRPELFWTLLSTKMRQASSTSSRNTGSNPSL